MALVPAVLALVLAGSGCAGDFGAGTDDPSAVDSSRSSINVAKFHGWEQIPGATFNSGPAIVAYDTQAETVCGLGMDGVIYCNFWSSIINTWMGWYTIGSNTFASRPSVAAFLDGMGQLQTALIAKTSAGVTMINITAGGMPQFQGWNPLPGNAIFAQPPAIVYDGHSLHVFGVKSNQRVYYSSNFVGATYSPANWSAFQEVPGSGLFTSAVAATRVLASGHLALAGRGNDGVFWINEGLTPGSMSGWRQLGGAAQDVAPGLVSRGTTVDVLGAFASDEFAHIATVDPTVASTPIFDTIPAGLLNTPCAAGARSAANLDVVGRGNDNAFWIDRWF